MDPHFLDLGCEWLASCPGCFLTGERASGYPLDRRLGGPQSWSGLCEEEKNS
jgi:hypothetical protein